jgi:hypothetical protein
VRVRLETRPKKKPDGRKVPFLDKPGSAMETFDRIERKMRWLKWMLVALSVVWLAGCQSTSTASGYQPLSCGMVGSSCSRNN